MSKAVPIKELENFVGQVTGVGDWVEISQERINKFADVTEDWQYIHVDEEKAKESMFGGTIAHGFLTLSMLVRLVEGACIEVEGIKTLINSGFEKVRFLSPVPSGSRIRASVMLKEVVIRSAGKRAVITNEITVEIEGGKKPALIADWVTMVM